MSELDVFYFKSDRYFDRVLKLPKAVILQKLNADGDRIGDFGIAPEANIALSEDLENLLQNMVEKENDVIEEGEFTQGGASGLYSVRSFFPLASKPAINFYRYKAIAKIVGFDFAFRFTGICLETDFTDYKNAIKTILASIRPLVEAETTDGIVVNFPSPQGLAKDHEQEQFAKNNNMRDIIMDDQAIAAKLDAAIKASGLSEKRDTIHALAMPAIRMIENGEADEDIGQSRIGGGPDLAPDTLWPRDSQGFYYNFLAQINLADIVDNQDYLPQQGLISLFYGNDGDDWHVMFNVDYYNFIRHDIADDAEDITFAAHNMVGWESDGNGGYRGVVTNKKRGDIEAQLDEDGRFAFYRDGQKLMAFASEQEIPRSCQKLKFLPCICLPYYFDKNVWQGIDFRRSLDLAIAVRDEMTFGEGPQHQMFGTYADAVSDMDGTICVKAAAYAKQQGWNDLEDDDWFILCALQGGGEVDFQFWDLGCFIIAANRKDTIKGDFSRTYAAIDSA
ncbi:YwqG family protein [Bartonella sp. HY329]|uniref:YwqG family protein n=1 Tax=unclassified Bartonella TaxID=2645622 RepID=UPI0021C6E6A1|nr:MULTISPECIES: YwqG family protein [unclassified Bartonella]UXM95304.1 YwqG family protein [Bartonella sp. HY329]UXN09629.1 YwqG family protein [Bartonella sp. HY328]